MSTAGTHHMGAMTSEPGAAIPRTAPCPRPLRRWWPEALGRSLVLASLARIRFGRITLIEGDTVIASDTADILSEINVTYDETSPQIAEENQGQAQQTGAELADLLAKAEDLRDREAGGEKFTPEQADQLGAEMQAQAEKIAGQVTQAAQDLGVEIQEA